MTPPATAADRVAHFSRKLDFETDPSDVGAALETQERFVLIDSRGDAAWNQGHAAGAVHMPTADISTRAGNEIALDMPVVVYCWGPGCNGGTKAALEFARLGYEVREMIGGFEYWAREGYPVADSSGPVIREKDPLTAPVSAISFDC
ncbi:sulfurtransferase [Salinibacterium sp. NSLL150]|uniref:rhodanese-like domain-containing protein n=1 Tax=unclassified Salinibacterium TaxID=2632331 RepID=UPI0018CE5C34|nr:MULTISPECIES: rhodanese-like domain-containing protein [unclassified Salinibacterium]MBH0100212.1 sulfurtransferase [Salinibacterium sp. NSLL35]MBH0102966.1 sulfurtransferase [Salinibacterium sp. NSLL150]MBH0105726.1 sulfurtransferase [Salinibacterium sp. NSLL16]MBH0108486.1 sulfurtransferase [Salinibacterium sp. NSLL17]